LNYVTKRDLSVMEQKGTLQHRNAPRSELALTVASCLLWIDLSRSSAKRRIHAVWSVRRNND
jgi:hypothetical protein